MEFDVFRNDSKVTAHDVMIGSCKPHVSVTFNKRSQTDLGFDIR